MNNQNTYHRQTAQMIAFVAQNFPDMSADVMQGWIENPRALKRALMEALCPPGVFPVWRTIKLGVSPKNSDEARKALRDKECFIGDCADDILNKVVFTTSAVEKEIDLVNVSVGELGFTGNGATSKDIYNRAFEFGLELCPAEVGPQLRLQYHEQTNHEWFRIAMEPIDDSRGDPSVFIVENSEGLYLHGGRGHPKDVWPCVYRWLFVRRR